MVLAATMRKLSPILNAVVRDQAPRQQNSVPTVTKPCRPTALLSNCLTEHGNTAEHRLLETDGKSIGIRFQIDCTTDKHHAVHVSQP